MLTKNFEVLTEAHARKQEPEEKQLFSCIRWFTLTLPLTFLNILCLNYLPSCERIPELAEVNGFFTENEVMDTFCAENTGKRPLLLLSSQVVKFKLKHKDAAIEWGPELVLCKQVNKAIWTFFISLPFLVRDVHEYAWGGAVCVTGHKSIRPFFLSYFRQIFSCQGPWMENLVRRRETDWRCSTKCIMFGKKQPLLPTPFYFQGVILYQNHVQPKILLNKQNTHM